MLLILYISTSGCPGQTKVWGGGRNRVSVHRGFFHFFHVGLSPPQENIRGRNSVLVYKGTSHLVQTRVSRITQFIGGGGRTWFQFTGISSTFYTVVLP